MPSDVLEWCACEAFSTGEDLLKQVFRFSGQQIKKYDFNKRWLQTPVKPRDLVRLPLELVNHHEVYPSYEGPPVAIVGESDNFLALHKPAGIHTHPQGYQAKANLVSWLATHGRAPLTRVNSSGQDRGCLYRLDQETSGLMLYAKSDAAYQQLRSEFSALVKKKIYLCIVKGAPGERELLEHRLAPFGPKGAQMRVAPEGELAQLSYSTLETKDGLSLVMVELKTGLRHQIRAQMAAMGFPLLGDTLYGGESAPRMYLHCLRYDLLGESWVDPHADLFNRFFDLNRLLQVVHDKLR